MQLLKIGRLQFLITDANELPLSTIWHSVKIGFAYLPRTEIVGHSVLFEMLHL